MGIGGLRSQGRSGRARGSLDPGPCRLGDLLDTAGPRTRAQAVQYSWSTPQALGHGPESPGTAGLPAGPRTRARFTRDIWSTLRASELSPSPLGLGVETAGARTRAQVTLDSFWTPQELVHGPWSPGTASRPRGTSDTITCRPGDLVDSAGPWTQARGTRESWSTPRELRMGLSRLGQMVDPAGPGTWVRVPRDSWSTPRALGVWPESPRTAARPQGHLDPGPSCPGKLVYTAGHRT